jgi:dTDP-4-amino-4,6-dideoxygalactose transaminase
MSISNDLKKLGIGNDVYYPTQVHRLPSFNTEQILPVSESATREVLSLPVHPGLSKRDLNRVAQKFNSLLKAAKT